MYNFRKKAGNETYNLTYYSLLQAAVAYNFSEIFQ